MSVAPAVDELPTAAAESSALDRIVWASVLGTVVEWYDFLIYGTAAALVFNKLFFPTLDPLAGTLAAFGAYAVGFVARPMGGLIFGHYGDRLGRKAMLTLTMVFMGVGTFLIGCLPTYNQIGIWAPVLLVILRLLQGIGVGGEWGGAVLMVIEHAPRDKRGLYGSLVQVGFPAGVAGSTATFLLLAYLPESDFLSWGWRLPFLLSVILIGVGLFVRLRLSETPIFQRVREADSVARLPLVEVFRNHGRALFVAIGLKASEVAWVYVVTVFSIVYATTKLGLPKTLILNAILAAALLEFLTIPLFGWMSDKVGRRNMYIGGALVSCVCAFVLFALLDTKNPTIIVVSIAVIVSLTHAIMFAPQAAFFPEMFGTRTRYSGASIGCQFSAAISGGFSPVIATGLMASFGASWPSPSIWRFLDWSRWLPRWPPPRPPISICRDNDLAAKHIFPLKRKPDFDQPERPPHEQDDSSTSGAAPAIGPYSQGTASERYVFASGQLPIDPKTGNIPEGIEAQTKQSLANLAAVLQAGGASLASVMKTTVFLKNMADFGAMNGIYAESFKERPPARSTIEVARLPRDALVEIEAIALKVDG
jgi:MHS family shikimate/dehydroshikimate transporter-like MFS transporter